MDQIGDGNIAFVNYFSVLTLYMEYCAHQHAKSPTLYMAYG